jgi:hypothetical protein
VGRGLWVVDCGLRMEAREKSVWAAFNKRVIKNCRKSHLREYVNTFSVGIVITLNLVLLLSTKGCPSQESPHKGRKIPHILRNS